MQIISIIVKMKLLQLLTFTSTALAIATETNANYDGYQVFRLKADEHNIGKINDIVSSLNLETWKSSAKIGIADIVVPPHQVENFLRTTEDFQRQVMHTDLGASIAEESQFNEYSAEAALAPNATWFTSYHTYATHLQFLRDLVTAYPSNAEIVTSGNSNAGNPITGIHIYGSGGKGSKPAVLFHGTVHAREWITTMVKMLEPDKVTEYVAYNLLSNYATSSEIKGFVDKYDYYIFPVVNPDGFLYTQSTDRMWRKNRQTLSTSTCVGRDINRNWAYQWSVAGGSSTNPCDETYRGLAAADAPETKGLAAFAKSLKAGAGLKLFIDFHSYSQLFMTRAFPPLSVTSHITNRSSTAYGYSCTALAENNSVLQSLAKGFVTALKAVYGTSFTYGPICSTIYQASGNSVDYLDATVGADYSFTTELRDTGTYGFVLPASQITPSAVESFAGVRSLLLNMV
ncbi:Zinc carboxypeptidase protein [Rutstroemia sp. NJR-2017a BVV2]|nr:Zinc carboxypeptidase protein [Rutstroemia sp. NJR-2017a BVV2]